LSTVPITEAIQMTVSSAIAKRIDESSSTQGRQRLAAGLCSEGEAAEVMGSWISAVRSGP